MLHYPELKVHGTRSSVSSINALTRSSPIHSWNPISRRFNFCRYSLLHCNVQRASHLDRVLLRAEWTENYKFVIFIFSTFISFPFSCAHVKCERGTIYGKSYTYMRSDEILTLQSDQIKCTPAYDARHRMDIIEWKIISFYLWLDLRQTYLFMFRWMMPSVGIYDALPIISITTNDRIAYCALGAHSMSAIRNPF